MAWGVLLFGLVVVTNRVTDLDSDRILFQRAANDSQDYLAIARAAPKLPAPRSVDDSLAFHRGQRFAIPYSVGLVSKVSGATIHTAFRISVLAVGLSIVLLLGSILHDLNVGKWQSRIVVALFVLNPWTLRESLTFPELINDIGFVLGTIVVIQGLVKSSRWRVVAGQAIASLSRQSGLLLVPMSLMWIWSSAYDRPRARKAIDSIAVIAAAVALYVSSAIIARSYSGENRNTRIALGGADWISQGFNVAMLTDFLGQLIFPFLAAAPFIVLAWIPGGGLRKTRPLLVGAALILAQVFLMGPFIVGGNGERLGALALIPLLVALGIWLRDAGALAGPDANLPGSSVILILSVMSLHHLYSASFLPFAGRRSVFGLVYATGLAILALIAFRQRETSGARPRTEYQSGGVK